jgi:hypothetical protein
MPVSRAHATLIEKYSKYSGTASPVIRTGIYRARYVYTEIDIVLVDHLSAISCIARRERRQLEQSFFGIPAIDLLFNYIEQGNFGYRMSIHPIVPGLEDLVDIMTCPSLVSESTRSKSFSNLPQF